MLVPRSELGTLPSANQGCGFITTLESSLVQRCLMAGRGKDGGNFVPVMLEGDVTLMQDCLEVDRI